jgi:hypothetical protein
MVLKGQREFAVQKIWEGHSGLKDHYRQRQRDSNFAKQVGELGKEIVGAGL